jgi:hypothetical protein
MMKKLTAALLSALTVVAMGMVSLNASAEGNVSSTYGKVVTETGACVKGSGKNLC